MHCRSDKVKAFSIGIYKVTQCQIPGHSSDKNCLNFRFCLTLEDEKIQVVQNFGYKKTFLFLNQFQNFLRLWVKKDQNFTLKLPIQD